MEREVDARIDIGHLDARRSRHTHDGIGEIGVAGIGERGLLIEPDDRRVGIRTDGIDLQHVVTGNELDRAAVLHHVECVVAILGGESDRAVGLPLVGLKDDLLEVPPRPPRPDFAVRLRWRTRKRPAPAKAVADPSGWAGC